MLRWIAAALVFVHSAPVLGDDLAPAGDEEAAEPRIPEPANTNLANATPPARVELPYSWVRDGVGTAVGLTGLLVIDALAKDQLTPDSCRWCEPPGFDESIRDALIWSDKGAARTASDVAVFGAVPVVSIGLLGLASWSEGRTSSDWAIDSLIVAEAMTLSMMLTSLVKVTVGRERPFVHALPEDEKDDVAGRDENNLSFFSGHTSFGFTIAAAAGTVASQRGSKWAPVIWGAGLTIAASGGYLRIAGDKHWASDVVVGAAIGLGVGIAVPRLLHRPRRRTETVSDAELVVLPSAHGFVVKGTF